jgi:GNAT superfamily N-acetyltransferase
MRQHDMRRFSRDFGYVRTLRQSEELPLLREHLLRLDRESRHDRFNGFLDDSLIERYAAKCADDGTVIIAYFERGVVRGAAELHPPDARLRQSLPEVAFSVEACARRQGVGSLLFQRLIEHARFRGYRSLRVTTGAQNRAMRALAQKFGAQLMFHQGESSGNIELKDFPPDFTSLSIAPFVGAAQAMVNFSRLYWETIRRLYGLSRTA